MKTENGHILTFSEKMQISAILCFATCDWFCPMTSQFRNLGRTYPTTRANLQSSGRSAPFNLISGFIILSSYALKTC